MKELLIPVGNYESLVSAINAGADAVYLGGKKFGARAFATNFNDQELVDAIKLCHLYGVKIYVTVNTLIYSSEINDVIEYIDFLHKNGVDAIIIQDLGLISILRKKYPNLELHASTQVNNTNQETIKFLENLGISRVVFARELSVDEIDTIKTNMEREAFIHGALCVSYSGECLFSSLVMDRSGNRGECAGMCRLPYKLLENDTNIKTNGDYILSPKELNTSTNFKRILDSSIYSLKVEGRMKSSEYVACVTMLYRDLLDKYYRGEDVVADKELLNDLSIIYNREYTNGYILNEKSIMNIKSPNHLGIHLGKVIKTTNKYVYIKLDHELSQEDGIRFMNSNNGMICNFIYDTNEKLINKASSGDVVLLDNKFNINEFEEINLTSSINVIKKYKSIDNKKINIDVEIYAHAGKELEMIISDGSNIVSAKSDEVLEYASKLPVDKDNIIKHFGLLKDTAFRVNSFDITLEDNLFINVKTIKELRRKLITELTSIRENNKKEYINNDINIEFEETTKKDINISVLVNNETQLLCAKNNNVDRIYVSDLKLYDKYKDSNVYLKGSKIYNNVYRDNMLINNIGGLTIDANKIVDYGIGITNEYTLKFLSDYSKILTLSVELKDEEIKSIMDKYKGNVELIIYGNIEIMTMKYCPLKENVNKDSICHVCTNENNYYLVDRNDKKYKIKTDPSSHISTLMNYKPIVKINNIDYYKDIGITNFRIDLLDEDEDKINEIINEIRNS